MSLCAWRSWGVAVRDVWSDYSPVSRTCTIDVVRRRAREQGGVPVMGRLDGDDVLGRDRAVEQ